MFKKNDKDKLDYTLLPPEALKEIVKVFQYGAKKYGRDNWRQAAPEDINRFLSAAYRHLEAYRSGEGLDKETKLPHLAHATTNLMIILALQKQINHRR